MDFVQKILIKLETSCIRFFFHLMGSFPLMLPKELLMQTNCSHWVAAQACTAVEWNCDGHVRAIYMINFLV